MIDVAARLEQIRTGGWRLHLHMNLGHAWSRQDSSLTDPRIFVGQGGPKGSSKKARTVKPWRAFAVDGVDGTFLTLEEAVIAAMKLDADADEARRWDAAAPKKPKPAAIVGMLEDE